MRAAVADRQTLDGRVHRIGEHAGQAHRDGTAECVAQAAGLLGSSPAVLAGDADRDDPAVLGQDREHRPPDRGRGPGRTAP